MSLHTNNTHAQKSGIAKNLLLAVRTVMRQQQVDSVAGDFNGPRRRRSGNEQRHDSTVEEAFANTDLPIPHGPTVLWDQVGFQDNGSMCAVSSCHLVPKLSGTVACTVHSKSLTKLLESNVPTRVATTKYGFISCMSTHGWLIAHPEMGIIGGHSVLVE